MTRLAFTIVRLTDAEIAECLSRISEDLGGGAIRFWFEANGKDRPQQPAFTAGVEGGALKPNDPALLEILQAGGTLFGFISLPTKVGEVGIERGPRTVDEVALNFNPKEHKAELAVSASKEFRPHFVVGQRFAGSLDELIEREDAALVKLRGIAEQVVADAARYRTKLDVEFAEYREKLKADTDAERTQVDEDRKSLEALRAELDDRSSRHARRRHLQDLKKALGARVESFNLSAATNRKRWPTHALFLVAIGVAFASFSVFGAEISSLLRMGQDPNYWLFVRFALAGASLVGLGLYYIRWTDAWAQRHADEEFRLLRLSLDADRAGWLVEMALEWRDERDQPISEYLVDRLSRNLFREGFTDSSARHPAEDLMSMLLAVSADAEINAGPFGKYRLKRRGARKLGKQINEADALEE